MKLLAPPLIFYIACLLNDILGANALRIHGRRRDGTELTLGRRATMQSDLDNKGDLMYYTTIQMGSPPLNLSVLIDTGSTDLAVNADVPGARDAGMNTSIQYMIGRVEGPIKFAPLVFEGFNIDSQAYIRDTTGGQRQHGGIIGLGPDSSSEIRDALRDHEDGESVLNHIFRTNLSTPNFMTVLLGRSQDPTDKYPGDLTVGSLIDGFENVTSMPKLPVTEVKSRGSQHWQVLVDAKGTIGPDGQPIQLGKDPKRQLRAVLDTGFTYPQVPKAISDAFYARVPNASFTNLTGVGPIYQVPCGAELNISFVFGGVRIPIHPLDTVAEWVDSQGLTICVGAFQPLVMQSKNYDMILGMSFLRNTYTLINFGDFVDGSTKNKNDPYVQLLPTTEMSEAHQDFVVERLMGVDTSSNMVLLPASSLPPQNADDDDFGEPEHDRVSAALPYIIAGASVLGAVILGGIIWWAVRGRTGKYQRLHEPAPIGLVEQQHGFQSYQPDKARRY